MSDMHTPTDAVMNEAADLIAELRGERDRLRLQLAAADHQVIAYDAQQTALVAALEQCETELINADNAVFGDAISSMAAGNAADLKLAELRAKSIAERLRTIRAALATVRS